jgi:type II secretory pathway pseudopilin PulG
LPLNLINCPASWVVSTDPALASAWNGPVSSAWLSTPLGVLAQGKMDDTLCILSVSDSGTELRSLLGYLGMGMPSLPLEPAIKQAILNGFNLIASQAKPSYEVIRQQGHVMSGESQGLLAIGSPSIAVVAIMAAIAIPNLLESRIAANEAAAASALKSTVFPAEAAFQAGNYHDRNKNGVGDFGFFTEMAGGPIPGRTDGVTLSLLPASWNAVNPFINGYHFAIYLPDGAGGALSADHDHDVPATADGPEAGFVAYAWPDSPSVGRRMFAINTGGMVYVTPFRRGDLPPVWNTFIGDHGWGSFRIPLWEIYRGGRGPLAAPPKAHLPPPPQTATPPP